MNIRQMLSLLVLVAASAIAAPPELQTPEPVIYLADNIDEQDALGWCIDTLGRGWSEQLQTHSCKPQGGDVQFAYDSDRMLLFCRHRTSIQRTAYSRTAFGFHLTVDTLVLG